jgi:hypothetical protein
MKNEENSGYPVFFLNNLGLLGFSAPDSLRNYLFSEKIMGVLTFSPTKKRMIF